MVIGLTGAAGAGKDHVYQRAAVLFPGMVERVAFADLLYQSAAAAIGVTVNDLREWKNDPSMEVRVGRGFSTFNVINIRQFLQRYGTEAHRDIFGTDFWVNQLHLDRSSGTVVFVTDVRFPNEADAVVRANGSLCNVIGPPSPHDPHVSEAGVARMPHYTIDNRDRYAAGNLDRQIRHVVLSEATRVGDHMFRARHRDG